MRIASVLGVAVLLFAMALGTPVKAGEVRVGVGQTIVNGGGDAVTDNGDSLAVGVDAAWNVTPVIRVGVDLSNAADIYRSAMAEVTFIRPDGAVRPYGVVGVGWAEVDGSLYATTDDYSDWCWEAGAGVEFRFRRGEGFSPFGLFVDATYVSLGDGSSYPRWLVGFGYEF